MIGNIAGGIVMALHSAQGPRMGIPQMISSRAQFGVYGACLPLILVVLMYLGLRGHRHGAVRSGDQRDPLRRHTGHRHRHLRPADA
ncbi:MAG: cytosine permease [Geodermatophilaceae bacterium]